MPTDNMPPRLIQRKNGDWLAVTPDDVQPKIGVIGHDEADAVGRFHEAMREWKAALNAA